MIPSADIDLWLDDPELASGLPTPDEVEGAGFADGNWDYDESYVRATWDDAADALPVERDLIEVAGTRASSGPEFDTIIDGRAGGLADLRPPRP